MRAGDCRSAMAGQAVRMIDGIGAQLKLTDSLNLTSWEKAPMLINDAHWGSQFKTMKR
jgi:hypothetical protein